jgi:hypothetical protein|tara:strand:+ start:152 stop:289 length:138 start_codon:yes stop_codon:yes gene_type:complete
MLNPAVAADTQPMALSRRVLLKGVLSRALQEVEEEEAEESGKCHE